MGRPLKERRAELIAEVDAIASEEGNHLRADAAYFKALLGMPAAREGGPDAVLAAIESFIALAPKDERGAVLLSKVAESPNTPPGRKATLLARIFAEYPDTGTVRAIKASVEVSKRRQGSVGKPFELIFDDAISHEAISLRKDMIGKVVVIDFWATWCGPCVAEIPKMKALYEKYKDKGVVFIGVSLDATDKEGLEAVTAFTKAREIDWPQFHGEAAYQFARTWGVTVIPSVFVVDSKGHLHTLDGHGKLDSLIPELLP
jgi:thiol-disulfide isomerase/thioredoxin